MKPTHISIDSSKEIRTTILLPNGKQPLKAHGGAWKPSDGYIEPKGSKIVQRCLAVLTLLVLAGLLTAVSML